MSLSPPAETQLHAGAQQAVLEEGVDARRQAVRLERAGVVVDEGDAVVARRLPRGAPRRRRRRNAEDREQAVGVHRAHGGGEGGEPSRLAALAASRTASPRPPAPGLRRLAPRVELDDPRRRDELASPPSPSALRVGAAPGAPSVRRANGQQLVACTRARRRLDDDQRARPQVVRLVGAGRRLAGRRSSRATPSCRGSGPTTIGMSSRSGARAPRGAGRRRRGTAPPAACARCPRRSRTPRADRRWPGG